MYKCKCIEVLHRYNYIPASGISDDYDTKLHSSAICIMTRRIKNNNNRQEIIRLSSFSIFTLKDFTKNTPSTIIEFVTARNNNFVS